MKFYVYFNLLGLNWPWVIEFHIIESTDNKTKLKYLDLMTRGEPTIEDHIASEMLSGMHHTATEKLAKVIKDKNYRCPSCGLRYGMQPYVTCPDEYHKVIYVNEDEGFSLKGLREQTLDIEEESDMITTSQKELGDIPKGRYEGCWLTILRFDGKSVSVNRCLDCGVMVLDKEEHDRFHAILNNHAKAIAVLIGAHLTENVHDRYDVRERIKNTSDGLDT